MDSSEVADKPLVWLHGEVRTLLLSTSARLQAGVLLRRLQRGESLGLPKSRPLTSIGRRCHELRIVDTQATWRIVYRVDSDAIVIAEVFAKKTRSTPKAVVDASRRRLAAYDALNRAEE